MDIYLDMFMSEMESPITCNLDVLSNHYLNFLKKLIECCNKYFTGIFSKKQNIKMP